MTTGDLWYASFSSILSLPKFFMSSRGDCMELYSMRKKLYLWLALTGNFICHLQNKNPKGKTRLKSIMIKRLAKLKNILIRKQRERINYNKTDHRQ